MLLACSLCRVTPDTAVTHYFTLHGNKIFLKSSVRDVQLTQCNRCIQDRFILFTHCNLPLF